MKQIDNMPYANQKVRELIEAFTGGNVSEFAKKIGLPQQNLNRLFVIDNRSGKYPRVSESIIKAIITKYSEVDEAFFYQGFKYNEKEEGLVFLGETKFNKHLEPSKSYDSNIGVPFYDTTFELGFDELENDQTRNPDYMIDFEPYNKCSAWVNARGDSMAPTISGGDILALKEIKDFRYLINDEVYGVVTRNGLRTIKRIRDNGNTFTLIPDNKNYAPQDIDKKEVLRVFQVMGCMKMF